MGILFALAHRSCDESRCGGVERYGKESPFFDEGDGVLRNSTFSAHVDLRSMFINGFAFDKSTAEWWSKQSDEAKAALLGNDSDEAPCQPIDVVVNDLFGWIAYIKKSSVMMTSAFGRRVPTSMWLS